MISLIIKYFAIFVALIIVLPLHEFAHAFVAVKSGDPTPKLYGRYSINPLAHFDYTGLLCFIFIGFGWAKPVPINPNNFKKYKLDSFLVAIAGVVVNYLTAFVVYPLVLLSVKIYGLSYFTDMVYMILYNIYQMGLVFCVFNLLPIYPLDGFRVVDVFCKKKSKFYYNYKKYGIILLYFLLALSLISDITNFYYIDILGLLLNNLATYVSMPIISFWGLFF